ncbi:MULTISPECIES: LacI family DNA-binding transcriptional regulator [unclassified Ruegeria]|uniref:LacI family DNA-binding transcriptional regulator n=1 Tax=unclassified Ruegeria TaxID=2625375 RepID=UPI001FFDF7AB|nr:MULTISPECIES: LacI family DNA-binding transcriptional regulator [unclassified Ruegeria]
MTTNLSYPLSNHSSQMTVSGRVKLDELAAHLGLSKSTVSRALNGYSDISPVTRARVEKAARALGYRPLSHAQAIRTGQVRAIAMVLNSEEPDQHNPFLQDFLAGACQAASSLDWTMTISTATSEKDTLKVLSRLYQERKADGFILPRTAVKDARIGLLRSLDVPHILYGRTGYGQPNKWDETSWFDIAGESAMRNAVLRLNEFGHSRIGFVGSDPKFNYAHLRRDGYAEGMQAAGLPLDTDLIREGARTREDGASQGRALMALECPPTAIVFATDLAALGFCADAQDQGFEIGRDISVIGYDGVPECQYARPALTTFSVDSRKAGQRLATLLIQQIQGAEPSTLQELVDATLVKGGSDGPPRLTPEELAQKRQYLTNQKRGDLT